MASFTGGIQLDPGTSSILIGATPRLTGIALGNLGLTTITDSNNNVVSQVFSDGKNVGQLWPRY